MFEFLHFGKKNKNIKIICRRREDIEPHEIFYDHLANSEKKSSDAAENKFEIALSKKSLVLPLILAGLFFLAVIFRVAQWQIIEGANLAESARQNKYIFNKIQSDRGIIYDSNLVPLVQNISTFDLQCLGEKMPQGTEREKIIESLAAITDANRDDLKNAIAANKIPTVENLNHRALIVLEARLQDFSGCAIEERPIRKYVQGAGTSHLLGYLGKISSEEWQTSSEIYSINDYIGRQGLEKSYETVLRKDPGKMQIERDALGNIVSRQIAQNPESGDNIRLWLDYNLQKKLYEAMARQFETIGLKKGAAVAINPKTGGIMALVSLPDYDNNIFTVGNSQEVQALFKNKSEPLFDRAISGRYLTGSTIKPFIAAAALQEGIIAADKNINCQGRISVQNQYNPEIVYHYNDNHVHGQTNMYKAIAESCNVYFYTIGGGYENQDGLGPTRIKKYLDLFGWEEATGIDLPGEIAGFVPDPAWKKERFAGTQDQNWTDGNTYWLSIGQEFIGITPIEVANAYAAIANGGTLYQPQMVKTIIDNNKNAIEEKTPEIIRENFIDADNLTAVREGMRHAVNGAGAPLASALTLNQLEVPMGAKTGTAQLGRSIDGKDLLNAWVAAFAPYDDPQIVLLVMAEEAREGTVAVLPVAKEVLGWYFEPKDENGTRPSELPAADAATCESIPEELQSATIPKNEE